MLYANILYRVSMYEMSLNIIFVKQVLDVYYKLRPFPVFFFQDRPLCLKMFLKKNLAAQMQLVDRVGSSSLKDTGKDIVAISI